MKLNLRTKAEGKCPIGCSIYLSDKLAIDALAVSKGVSVSLLLRSMINDLIDGNITIDV